MVLTVKIFHLTDSDWNLLMKNLKLLESQLPYKSQCDKEILSSDIATLSKRNLPRLSCSWNSNALLQEQVILCDQVCALAWKLQSNTAIWTAQSKAGRQQKVSNIYVITHQHSSQPRKKEGMLSNYHRYRKCRSTKKQGMNRNMERERQTAEVKNVNTKFFKSN